MSTPTGETEMIAAKWSSNHIHNVHGSHSDIIFSVPAWWSLRFNYQKKNGSEDVSKILLY